jgi:hypothetical protein
MHDMKHAKVLENVIKTAVYLVSRYKGVCYKGGLIYFIPQPDNEFHVL